MLSSLFDHDRSFALRWDTNFGSMLGSGAGKCWYIINIIASLVFLYLLHFIWCIVSYIFYLLKCHIVVWKFYLELNMFFTGELNVPTHPYLISYGHSLRYTGLRLVKKGKLYTDFQSVNDQSFSRSLSIWHTKNPAASSFLFFVISMKRLFSNLALRWSESFFFLAVFVSSSSTIKYLRRCICIKETRNSLLNGVSISEAMQIALSQRRNLKKKKTWWKWTWCWHVSNFFSDFGFVQNIHTTLTENRKC